MTRKVSEGFPVAKPLNVPVGLIVYLRSGESTVGFLNKRLLKNMLHKDMRTVLT